MAILLALSDNAYYSFPYLFLKQKENIEAIKPLGINHAPANIIHQTETEPRFCAYYPSLDGHRKK